MLVFYDADAGFDAASVSIEKIVYYKIGDVERGG